MSRTKGSEYYHDLQNSFNKGVEHGILIAKLEIAKYKQGKQGQSYVSSDDMLQYVLDLEFDGSNFKPTPAVKYQQPLNPIDVDSEDDRDLIRQSNSGQL